MAINGLDVLLSIEHKVSVLCSCQKAVGNSRAQSLNYNFNFLICCYLDLKCPGAVMEKKIKRKRYLTETMLGLFFTDLKRFQSQSGINVLLKLKEWCVSYIRLFLCQTATAYFTVCLYQHFSSAQECIFEANLPVLPIYCALVHIVDQSWKVKLRSF